MATPRSDKEIYRSLAQARDKLDSRPPAKYGMSGGDPFFGPDHDTAYTTGYYLMAPSVMNELRQYQSRQAEFPQDFEQALKRDLGIPRHRKTLRGTRPHNIRETSLCAVQGVTSGYNTFVDAYSNTFAAGDKILCPLPSYGLFMQAIKEEHFASLQLQEEDSFKINPQALDFRLAELKKQARKENPERDNKTSPVKAFVLINPHNPSGAVHSEAELKQIAKVLKKHKVPCVIEDMAYYGTERDKPARSISKFMPRETITFIGVAKALGMPAIRIGAFTTYNRRFKRLLLNEFGRRNEHVGLVDQLAFYMAYHHSEDTTEARGKQFRRNARCYARKEGILRAIVDGIAPEKKAAFLEDFEQSSYDPEISDIAKPIESIKLLILQKGVVAGNQEYADAVVAEIEALNTDKTREQLDKVCVALSALIASISPEAEDTLLSEALFTQCNDYLQTYSEKVVERIDILEKILCEDGILGIRTRDRPEAGFFISLDASPLYGKYFDSLQNKAVKIESGFDLCLFTATQCDFTFLPGECFDNLPDGKLAMRLTFARADDTIISGLAGLARNIGQLRNTSRNIGRGTSGSALYL